MKKTPTNQRVFSSTNYELKNYKLFLHFFLLVEFFILIVIFCSAMTIVGTATHLELLTMLGAVGILTNTLLVRNRTTRTSANIVVHRQVRI